MIHSDMEPAVWFGWDPTLVSLLVLGAVYAFIILDRLNAMVVALLGAMGLIVLGVLNQSLAIQGIDFNTLFLLIGMMLIVGIMKRTGVFQYVAIVAAKSVRGNPRSLLALLTLITAVFSAFLDNVTTVMLIVPITLLLCEQLKLKAFPFLFGQIFASNIGGTATLIGDPPNILIGSSVGLSFVDFAVNLGPAVVFIMAFYLLLSDFVWGRKLTTTLNARAHLMRYNAREAIEDFPLLLKSLAVLAAVIFGFIAGHGAGIAAGTTAMFGAAALLAIDIWPHKASEQTKRVHAALHTVEWETIFFFLGLFVVVFAVERTGVLAQIAQQIVTLTQGDMAMTGVLVLWGSALVSALINNIPFVATMIPLIEAMAPDFGGAQALEPLWWCLALGACLGGNGTLIGASANVMVASFAERAGQRISFVGFMLLAFPTMLLTIVLSTVYVMLVYFL